MSQKLPNTLPEHEAYEVIAMMWHRGALNDIEGLAHIKATMFPALTERPVARADRYVWEAGRRIWKNEVGEETARVAVEIAKSV